MKMNYRDTIEYREYCLSYYRDSKKKHYRSALIVKLSAVIYEGPYGSLLIALISAFFSSQSHMTFS